MKLSEEPGPAVVAADMGWLFISLSLEDGSIYTATLKEIISRMTNHGGESRGMNDRVHGISCRFSDKTGEDIGHIFLNTQSIFMQ